MVVAPSASSAQDSDFDGVGDSVDAFPCDASAVAGAWAPSQGAHGAVLFEDEWPSHGDFDFNDVVVGYRYEARLDANGKATSLLATFNVLALGGQLHNGLGLHLPLLRSSVSAVRRRVDGGAFSSLALASDSEFTVEVSADLREVFGGTEGQINSRADLPRQVGSVLEVEVQFATPTALDLGGAPFDLFIFRAHGASHQLHLPQFSGTAIVNSSLFGTAADASAAGRFYLDARGVPFALHIPQTAQTDDDSVIVYPLEATDLTALFTRLVLFAGSGGVDGADFYLTGLDTTKGFRDAQGLSAPAPRLPSVAPTCTLLPPEPQPVAFTPVVNATPGRTYVSNAVTLAGFIGSVDISVAPGFMILESHDLDACLVDLGQSAVLADPTSYIASLGYSDSLTFVAVECPTRLVTAQSASRIAGDTLQLVAVVSSFATTATSPVQTPYGDVLGTWSVATGPDVSDFYVSQGGVGDCSASAPCDLAFATQHPSLGSGDSIVLASDLSVASLSLPFPVSIRSEGARKILAVTGTAHGSVQVGSRSLGPTAFTNVELQYYRTARIWGATVTLTDSVFRSISGRHQVGTQGGASLDQSTRYAVDIQGCTFVDGLLTTHYFNDMSLLGNTFTNTSVSINEEWQSLAGRSVVTLRNNDFGGYTGSGSGQAVRIAIGHDADVTFENNVVDSTGWSSWAGAVEFFMWQGTASLFIHNNTLAADFYGLIITAPFSRSQQQYMCVDISGNQIAGYAEFKVTSSDPTISEIQVENFSQTVNQIEQQVRTYGAITDVAPGTCAARP